MNSLFVKNERHIEPQVTEIEKLTSLNIDSNCLGT